MLQATRREHDLSLGRHQAHCGALYLSDEELVPQMVCTAGHAKATYQKFLGAVAPLEQRALGLCEAIEVLCMGHGLLSLPAPSVGLDLSKE